MEWLSNLIGSAEFWMGLSLIAAALPGPQTRLIPALLRAIGQAVAKSRGGGQAGGI